MYIDSLEGRIEILLCKLWCSTKTFTDRDHKHGEDVLWGEVVTDNWAAMV